MPRKPHVPEEHHFHACTRCGNIWDHDPPNDEVSHDQFEAMHHCVTCGKECRVAFPEPMARQIAAAEKATPGGAMQFMRTRYPHWIREAKRLGINL